MDSESTDATRILKYKGLLGEKILEMDSGNGSTAN